ncbi:MAG: SIR2 family protein [Acidimicrobiales bacterium]
MKGLYFSGGSLRFHINDDDSIRRLRDALGQMLQVNQLCLLIGSGASMHLGLPRIRHVDSAFVRAVCQDAGATLSADESSLLDALLAHTTDLEEVLFQLVAAITYAKTLSRTDVEIGENSCSVLQLNELFSRVNAALASACVLPRAGFTPEAPHDTDPWFTHKEFLRRVLGARRPDAARTRIFTTNYDTAIEQSLDEAGIYYLDGFVGSIHRTLNISSYENDLYFAPNRGRPSIKRVHELVHLYKLHGSVNWRVGSLPSGFGATRIVQESQPLQPGERAVIYPTPAKEVDVVGYPYADLLRVFGASLGDPECALIVIGYGFADDHINRLIFQAMTYNSTLQLFVAVPDGVTANEESPERLDTPIGRLSAVNDPRISVLTGEAARFAQFAFAPPDVAERTPAQQETLQESLASALLDNMDSQSEGTL